VVRIRHPVTRLAAQAKGSDPTAKIAVDNTRDVPVVVYLDRGIPDVRLGTVQPHTTPAAGR